MANTQAQDMRRDANVAKMGAQLKDWSNRLDVLTAGCVEAGAGDSDPQRLRVDGLRAQCVAVQTLYDDYQAAPSKAAPWGTFRAGVAEGWGTLEAGFRDLSSAVPAKGTAEAAHSHLGAVAAVSGLKVVAR